MPSPPQSSDDCSDRRLWFSNRCLVTACRPGYRQAVSRRLFVAGKRNLQVSASGTGADLGLLENGGH